MDSLINIPVQVIPAVVVDEKSSRKEKKYIHSTTSGLKYNPKGTVYYQTVVPFLKIHQKASHIGTTGDLFTILSKEIPKYDYPPELPTWDYSKPTISTNFGLDRSDKFRKKMEEKSFSIFEKKLAEPVWFDEVTKFVQNTPGLIMAGGYVVKTYLSLFGHDYGFDDKLCQDIDLFLTGPAASSPGNATKIVVELEKTFVKYCNLFPDRCKDYSISRTSNCINFFLRRYSGGRENYEEGGNIAQVILRRYCHPSEVLHSFDLGSCQLAYDGKDVFTTSVGLLAIKMGINIIDMTRRRRTYERRLLKYFDRGFGIVFPNLSLDSLEKKIIETPYFKISRGAIPNLTSEFRGMISESLDLDPKSWGPVPKFSPLIYGNVYKEEYSGMVESYQIQIDDKKLQDHNISNYIRQKSYGTKPYYLIKIDSSDIFDGRKICDDSIKVRYNSYWICYGRIVEDVYSDVLNIKLKDMKDYLTPSIIKMLMSFILDSESHLRREIAGKIAEEIKSLVKVMGKELPEITVPLKWKSPGEGNDLNASFGMERVPIEKWYGEHYLPLDWDETKFKYYPQEVKDSIQTIMLVRNRETSYIRFLPMEIMFCIFSYLVSK
uniref:Uncharacterized protein n=1 Tax=Pithovirus LCPAC202 TaxID=2506592 RepID=A0A481Z651_9VIRU|nr:MAG: hypothetical protein LCPAC202_03020 [Pithovirus LCPAC202]